MGLIKEDLLKKMNFEIPLRNVSRLKEIQISMLYIKDMEKWHKGT